MDALQSSLNKRKLKTIENNIDEIEWQIPPDQIPSKDRDILRRVRELVEILRSKQSMQIYFVIFPNFPNVNYFEKNQFVFANFSINRALYF